MALKVLYFTEGTVETEEEAAEIAALKALTEPVLTLGVRSAAQSPNFGLAGIAGAEGCDYLAGSPPEAYGATGGSYEDTPTYAIPDPAPAAGEVGVVFNGQELAVTGGTVAITVEAGVVTAEFTADP